MPAARPDPPTPQERIPTTVKIPFANPFDVATRRLLGADGGIEGRLQDCWDVFTPENRRLDFSVYADSVFATHIIAPPPIGIP